MSTVAYTWKPDPVVFADAIITVEESLRDRSVPLLAAREFTQEDIRDRFETETDPDGVPWDKWAQSYKEYAENFPNIGILRQTGELYDAASSSAAFIINSDTVFYDSGYMPERGVWHQEGRPARTTRGGTANPLPARPFLGLSDSARLLIFATFADWFDRSIDLFVTARGRMGRRHSMRGDLGRFIPRSMPMPARLR